MNYHAPVLSNELLGFARKYIIRGRTSAELKDLLFVDATIGDGGHSLALFSLFPQARVVGFDRDPQMLSRASQRLGQAGISVKHFDTDFRRNALFARERDASIALCHSSFDTAARFLQERDLHPALILLDLGVSLYHLKEAKRGFSYLDESLDMRFDTASGTTAAQLINHCSLRELMRIFRNFGEEPYAHRLAKAIVKERPFTSAYRLGETIRKNAAPKPKKYKRIHPATRIFQALRIAVNRELDILDAGLEALPPILAPGGILAVISFHSLEDRMVKQRFKELGVLANKKAAEKSPFLILTRRPVVPSREEVSQNPPSRSARLRILLARI